ncbi:hypothetical protein [Lutibacter sp.]|uniref:hypothetical protein n=1 Tax=Lutibacter sp. TaxID=1925666 RepID=UPI00349FD607
MKNFVLTLIAICVASFWIAYLDIQLTGGDYFDDLRWWGWIAISIFFAAFLLGFYVTFIRSFIETIKRRFKK